MQWKTRNALGRYGLTESLEMAAPVRRVFANWQRCEDFPVLMHAVRRIKRIDETRVLWDVDILGRQVVWEARIVESSPDKLIRWESIWGARNDGEVRFEEAGPGRTRVTVQIEFEARGPIEHLGARLGVVDHHVREDLGRFRRFVENASDDEH